MLDIIFAPDMWLDRRSLFHVLIWVIVWVVVQNTNYKKIQQLQKQMNEEFVWRVKPYIDKLPKKVRKKINLRSMTKPLWYRFDLHSVLMVAFFREILEMYMERGEIFPYFPLLIPGQEHWVNRLILDPIMLVIWYRIARAFPNMFWPAMTWCAFLFAWLVL